MENITKEKVFEQKLFLEILNQTNKYRRLKIITGFLKKKTFSLALKKQTTTLPWKP